MTIQNYEDEIEEYKLKEESIELYTFPDDDKDYCKWFIVPSNLLLQVLESMDSFNNRERVNISRFLDNYTWDETYIIYCIAKTNGVIIDEGEIQ